MSDALSTPNPLLSQAKGGDPEPLRGQTILVTRPKGQAAGLAEPLEALGATVVSLPAIAIVPPEDFEELDAALYDVDRFDWLVFTSVNGVEAARDRMDTLGLNRRGMGPKIAAVGPATAQASEEAFYAPDAMPERYVSDAVADAMGDVRGQRVLLLRADIARREIVDVLQARGALVEDVAAYRIVRPTDDAPLLEAAPDWICLTSSSAALGTRDALAARGKEGWMRAARLACIGPLTAATVREMGYEVAARAREATVASLVEAVVAASGSLPLSGGGGQGGGGKGVRSASAGVTTPSPTVPPAVRAGALTTFETSASRLQGEPSPEEPSHA